MSAHSKTLRFTTCPFLNCTDRLLVSFETFEKLKTHIALCHDTEMLETHPGDIRGFRIVAEKDEYDKGVIYPVVENICKFEGNGVKGHVFLAYHVEKSNENFVLYVYGIYGDWPEKKNYLDLKIEVYQGPVKVPPAVPFSNRQTHVLPFSSPDDFTASMTTYPVKYNLTSLWKLNGDPLAKMIHLSVIFKFQPTKVVMDAELKFHPLTRWEETTNLHPSIRIPFLSQQINSLQGPARIFADAISKCPQTRNLILVGRDCDSVRLGILTPLLNRVIIRRQEVNHQHSYVNIHGVKPILVLVISSGIMEYELKNWITTKMPNSGLHIFTTNTLKYDDVRGKAIERCDILITSVQLLTHALAVKTPGKVYLSKTETVLFWNAEMMQVMDSADEFHDLMNQIEDKGGFFSAKQIYQYNERRFYEGLVDMKHAKPEITDVIMAGPLGKEGIEGLWIEYNDVLDLARGSFMQSALAEVLDDRDPFDCTWVFLRNRKQMHKVISTIKGSTHPFNIATLENYDQYDTATVVETAIKTMKQNWPIFVTTPYFENLLDIRPPNLIVIYGVPNYYQNFMSILRIAINLTSKPRVYIINDGNVYPEPLELYNELKFQ